MRFTVACNRALIETGGNVSFYDNDRRLVTGISVCKISLYGSGERSHACLDEDMCRAVAAVFAQLFVCLISHGPVSLHDPGRNLLIAFPGSILDDHSVWSFICFGGSLTDTVVVVQILDGCLGILIQYVVQAGLGGSNRHVDDTFLV